MRDLFCIAITLTAALAAGIFTGRRTMNAKPIEVVLHGGPFHGRRLPVDEPIRAEIYKSNRYPGVCYLYEMPNQDQPSELPMVQCHLHYVCRIGEPDVTSKWNCE